MVKRIKEFENSKAEGYLRGIWRGKSDKEKDRDKQEIAVRNKI